jgi:hypothetical protein
MALEVEGVVDGGMHAEKALCGACRLEPLHFALASSQLRALQYVSCAGTQVTDLGPLAGLTALQSLIPRGRWRTLFLVRTNFQFRAR